MCDNKRPLEGKRIVVTRSPDQAPAFCEKLAAAGAVPIAAPAIQLTPLSPALLDAALAKIGQYQWLIFTSGNAVDFFFARVDVLGVTPDLPRVAASGSATARKLSEQGVTVDFIPDEFVGESLVWGLGDLQGQRVLLPRAKIGRPEIVRLLQAQGAKVDDIPLYDTVTADPDPAALAELEKGVDAITFTSPSSVRNFVKIVAQAGLNGEFLETAVIACIGPITADAARERGLIVTVTPEEYTIDGLIAALNAHYRPQTVAAKALEGAKG